MLQYAPFPSTATEKEKIIAIFESYRTEHGEYPTTRAIKKLKQKYPRIIPSPRSIDNRGGLMVFYKSILGLDYIDARTGIRRANVATKANIKSQSLDSQFSVDLIKKYGEANVHFQSPYNKNGLSLHRSDFKVYKPDGNIFFVDLFFPQDMDSLQGCVNIKVNKLKKIKVEKNAPVFLVSCNEEWTTPLMIRRYLVSKKSKWPANIYLIHISEAEGLLI